MVGALATRRPRKRSDLSASSARVVLCASLHSSRDLERLVRVDEYAWAVVPYVRRKGEWRNSMRDSPGYHAMQSASVTTLSRRSILAWTAKLACGAALTTTVAGARWAQPAAAQGDEIVLTGAASEVGAMPGSSYAQGAAAFAGADSQAGSITAGAANTAVAPSGGGTGGGSGSGPGSSTGAGPGGGGGGGGGGGTGAGPGYSTGGGGGGTGAGPGPSDGSGPGDQSGGGGGGY
jgi:hypothetical protein